MGADALRGGERRCGMRGIQRLLVVQNGESSMMFAIDWDKHISWFEVSHGIETVKCKTIFEAHCVYDNFDLRRGVK